MNLETARRTEYICFIGDCEEWRKDVCYRDSYSYTVYIPGLIGIMITRN